MGTENILNQTAEKWFKKVSPKCSYGHNEYKTWWFQRIGEPKVEIPVKHRNYNYDACDRRGRQFTTYNEWTMDSFTNHVDASLFIVPDACWKLEIRRMLKSEE